MGACCARTQAVHPPICAPGEDDEISRPRLLLKTMIIQLRLEEKKIEEPFLLATFFFSETLLFFFLLYKAP